MKIYSPNDDETAPFTELNSVSMCFRDAGELRKFALFVMNCAEKFDALGDSYDHEHYNAGSEADVILARLLE